MNHIDHELIKCDCTEKSCPVYSKCCFLPTEVHPNIEDQVELLFVGQGGGADERKHGRPFIGRSGKRLRQQILYARQKVKAHIGIAFSNTIRDNPNGNRVPTSDEYEFCMKYLYRDIAILMNRGLRVVILLGNASKSIVLPKSKSMTLEHGKFFNFSHKIFGTILVMPTYHPSYIIRNAPIFNEKNISDYDKPVIEDIIRAYEDSMEIVVDDIEITN